MKTVVFLGPSLSLEQAKEILPDAHYYPPVKCGDIIHVLHQKPARIAIIDGYFENVAAVWHKEILFALECGVEVYGASSMGALRAAELAPFGMKGVGKIFEDFYNGYLQDDDEVTVVHRPPQSGYTPVTDAMVNIRATFQKALAENIIDQHIFEYLIAIAKNLFYKKRYFSKIFILFEEKYPKMNISHLKKWISEENSIDQKAEDAKQLLSFLKNNVLFSKINFSLHKTILLQKLIDLQNCEPIENNEEDEYFLGYVRLLAYALKTSEKLGIENDFVKIQPVSLFHEEIMGFFCCLLILFDEILLAELYREEKSDFQKMMMDYLNQPKTKAPYVKALLFCAFVMFHVSQMMQAQKVVLHPHQKDAYAEALTAYLPQGDQKEMRLPFGDDDQLIATYFILKDMINNSVDTFLVGSPRCFNELYTEKAKNWLKSHQ